MLPFGMTIPGTVPQRLEIPEGLMNYPVYCYAAASFDTIKLLSKICLRWDSWGPCYLFGVGQLEAVLFVCRTSGFKITCLEKVMRSCRVIRRRWTLWNLTNPSLQHHSCRYLVFIACLFLYFSNYLTLKATTREMPVWICSLLGNGTTATYITWDRSY